jgi:hypothetical protein
MQENNIHGGMCVCSKTLAHTIRLHLLPSLLETEGKHDIYSNIKVYTKPTECHSLHIADPSLNNMMDTPTQVSRV